MTESDFPSVFSPASFTVVADDVSIVDLYRSSHTCYLEEEVEESCHAADFCDPYDGDPIFGDPTNGDATSERDVWLASALAGA